MNRIWQKWDCLLLWEWQWKIKKFLLTQCNKNFRLELMMLKHLLLMVRQLEIFFSRISFYPMKHKIFNLETEFSSWADFICSTVKIEWDYSVSCYVVFFLDKEMATHCSILAWRIPWTEKPVRLPSIGSQRVGHNWMSTCGFWCVSISWSHVEQKGFRAEYCSG